MTTATPGPCTTDDQSEVINYLEQGHAFGMRPKRIDTHGASIFLADDRAWKLKRAVRFGYLDFSTIDRRRTALEAELRLNSRTAPGLYLALHPLVRAPDGQIMIAGSAEEDARRAIDWLLEMKRFPDGALLSEMAERGPLDEPLLVMLADRISAFHAAAEPVPVSSESLAFRSVVDGNIASMKAFPGILDPALVARVAAAQCEVTDAMAPVMDLRAREGRVRRCHGDLHLANIALIDGLPTLFDCLEFDEALARIDVLYDLAFLLMDLWHRGLRMEANLVFNRYLDLSPADEAGLGLLPLFLSVRATIRAHVLAAQSQRAGNDPAMARAARAYLELAGAMLATSPPRLIAIGGLSGTGKSSLARRLAGLVGRAPGARILRSDVLRKRLAGLAPEQRLPAEHYSRQSSGLVYETMGRCCAAALGLGQAAIADAVFAQRSERDRIEAVARQCGVAFDGLWLEATLATRVERVAGRHADASDADRAVVERQAALDVGALGGWQRLPVDGPLAETTAAARALLHLS